jgi:hypothetical protein
MNTFAQRFRFSKIVFFTAAALAAGALFSCSPKPSFTDENILGGVKEILLEEFDIDALVKRNDTTLGVCFTVPRLFTADYKTAPIVGDLMQNVLLCLRRVLLSTNADIRFFQINIRGEDTSIELSFIKYLRDLKIVLLTGISWDDYLKRRLNRNLANLASLGKKKIAAFFNDLGRLKPEKVISNHFASNIKREHISPDFLTWIWESLMKMNIRHEILDTRMKALDEDRYLFYVKVREHFERKHGFQNFSFSTFPGEEVEYLFEIVPLNYYDAAVNKLLLFGESDREAVSKIVKQHGDPQKWPREDFFTLSLTIEDFIAEQIAGRIQFAISENESGEDNPSLLPRLAAVKGIYEDQAFKIIFVYRNRKDTVESQDADLALQTTKTVCDLYKFNKCESIKIGTLSGPMTTYPFQ